MMNIFEWKYDLNFILLVKTVYIDFSADSVVFK